MHPGLKTIVVEGDLQSQETAGTFSFVSCVWGGGVDEAGRRIQG